MRNRRPRALSVPHFSVPVLLTERGIKNIGRIQFQSLPSTAESTTRFERPIFQMHPMSGRRAEIIMRVGKFHAVLRLYLHERD